MSTLDEQYAVMGKALDIFQQRNAVHQDAWKQDGAQGSLEHIRHKLIRMQQMIRFAETPFPVEQFVEEGLDLINYAAFAVRNVQDGRVLTPEI